MLLSYFCFITVSAFSQLFQGGDAGQCRSEYSSTFQRMLIGHTFKKLKTISPIECWQACKLDSHCESVNYVFFQNICELNNILSHRCSTTVSLETYPLYSFAMGEKLTHIYDLLLKVTKFVTKGSKRKFAFL